MLWLNLRIRNEVPDRVHRLKKRIFDRRGSKVYREPEQQDENAPKKPHLYVIQGGKK